MTPWQKRARLAVAVLALGVIAVVGYTIRPRQAAAPPPPVERLDPTAKIETRGGDVIQLKGERRDLRIEFQGQVTYENGQTKLVGVKVLAENRGGRNYTITGKELQVGKDQSSFAISGDVRLATDDGLVANSQEASYADAEKLVRAPGPVTFTRGRLSGSGNGFIFDEQRDTLAILDQAVVRLVPDAAQGAMDVTAGFFIYARRDRYLRFEKTMHMVKDGQVIDAAEATMRLFADRDETDMMELRGQASVGGGTATPTLRTMSARDINLDYADDGRTLQNATLAGRSQIQLATSSGAAGQRLEGELTDIAFQPDGSVRSLVTRDNVVVTLPATRETPARTIRSAVLTAAGTPQGLREMKFAEGVEYREAAVKGQNARVVRARTLEAALEAASGALVQAHFIAGVEFTDGPMRATAVDAVYRLAQSTLTLSGADPRPHVENDSLTIDANAIEVTLDPRRMSATGRVNSRLLPVKAATGTAAANRPALLGDSEPVIIVAEKLAYDESTRKADYSGQARLLQGETTITADSLTVDEAKGDLAASGKVLTTLAIAEKEATPGAKAKPMIASAGSFTYADQTRLATYTTTAQLDGDQGNLRAAKIELLLAKGDNTLERLEANGQVTALVDRRTVTGTRLTYAPDAARYIVTGGPVRMVDAECQETTGKTLTFWKASDRVQVDGNNEVRVQTKGGAKCPQVPPQ